MVIQHNPTEPDPENISPTNVFSVFTICTGQLSAVTVAVVSIHEPSPAGINETYANNKPYTDQGWQTKAIIT